MERKRVALAVVLGVAVIIATLLGGMWLFPTGEDTHPAGEATDLFTSPDHDSYSATGAIYTDGELFIEFSAEITANGSQYKYTESLDRTIEYYAPADEHGVLYTRYEIQNHSEAQELIGDIEADDDEVVVDRNTVQRETDEHIELLTVGNESERHVDRGEIRSSVETTTSLIPNNLLRVQYAETSPESDVTDGADTVTYAPVDGWYANPSIHRISDSDGTVTVDDETYEIQHVDVSYSYTPVSNWIEYYLDREETATIGLEYTIDTDTPTVTTPDWVAEVE